MGEKRQNLTDIELEGYTKVDGLAIAALITRAMPPAARERAMELITARSPVTGAALENSIVKVELKIKERNSQLARQSSKQIPAAPEDFAKPVIKSFNAQIATPAGMKSDTTMIDEENLDNYPELSPAEQLLNAREGTHEDLERELERQRSSPGRRRIISA